MQGLASLLPLMTQLFRGALIGVPMAGCVHHEREAPGRDNSTRADYVDLESLFTRQFDHCAT
jgi:hypothetical protein